MRTLILASACCVISTASFGKVVVAKFGYETYHPSGSGEAVASYLFKEPGYYRCTVQNLSQSETYAYFQYTYSKGTYPSKAYPHLKMCGEQVTSKVFSLFSGQSSTLLKIPGCISNAGSSYTMGPQFTRVGNKKGAPWSTGIPSHNQPGFQVTCHIQTEI